MFEQAFVISMCFPAILDAATAANLIQKWKFLIFFKACAP